MPILMPSDTKVVLRADAEKCDSRSLFLDRFADPAARDEDGARKKWFQRLIAKPVALHRPALPLPAGSPPPLYAQLQSRLLVNMAGGVMENAGLALDRFGLPFIPGSAVKGCARRAGLAALHEWSTTGHKPGASPDDADNLFKPACAPFGSAAEMLAAIAQVFGWGDSDWKESSDFAWATGGADDRSIALKNRGLQIRRDAARLIAAALATKIPNEESAPWDHLPSFAGSIAFLLARPVDLGKTGEIKGIFLAVPQAGQLELDIVTCHHRDYYASSDPYATAPDTSEPIPAFFPAIAAGHVFAFSLLRLRGACDGLVKLASDCLNVGLATFGLGAKTAAGYGWFNTEASLQTAVTATLEQASLKPDDSLVQEFLQWDDKKVRKAAAAYAFVSMLPKSGPEASPSFQFTLVRFILEHRAKLYLEQKNHAGSDFAKGVRYLATQFGLTLP